MDNFTDLEKKLYQIIWAFEGNNIPIIYKGATVTKLILQENHFAEFIRHTKDIDAC
jgi:hypothetical protein